MLHIDTILLAAATLILATSAVSASAKLPALRVSDDGHFLVTEDGQPFFWQGGTAWKLLYWPTLDEVDLYLQNRRAKGFNVLMVTAINPWGRPNIEGEYALIDNDPLQPNEKFWKRADEIIRRCNDNGIYVALTLAWGSLVLSKPIINRQNARAWGRWIARRYQDAAVVWVLGGDQPVADNIDLWDQMAAGIREADNKHLITYHPCGRLSSSMWLHSRPWLDFNMLQTGHIRDWPGWKLALHDWALDPPKPVVDGEPPYEHIANYLSKERLQHGDIITAWDCRKAWYWDVFAGAAGVTYGCNEVYRFWQPGRPGRPWGETTPWKKLLDLPGSWQIGHLKRLMLSRPYLTRIPDQSLITAGQRDGASHVQATRASDGSYAMVYIPDGHKIRVDISKLSGERLQAWWFNPRDGKIYDRDGRETERPFSNFRRDDGDRGFEPPTSGPEKDWVLVIDEASRGFAPPGQ